MAYIGRTTDGFGVRQRFVFTPNAGTTSISGNDVSGATLTFSDSVYMDVFLNGVLLKAGTDYNTNTANTIAGLTATVANDEVTVLVYDIFTTADMVSATSGGTFKGDVVVKTDDGGLLTLDIVPTVNLKPVPVSPTVAPRTSPVLYPEPLVVTVTLLTVPLAITIVATPPLPLPVILVRGLLVYVAFTSPIPEPA